MKLIVYKGFETDFLRTVTGEALSATPIADKRNVLFFSKAMRKQLQIALITNADEDGEWWVTYEEFSLIISNVESALKAGDLEVLVVTNNLYPGSYPLPFSISDDLMVEISACLEKVVDQPSEACSNYLTVFTSLESIDGINYASFYNYEAESASRIQTENYYPMAALGVPGSPADLHIHISNDIPLYLKEFSKVLRSAPSSVGYSLLKGRLSELCLNSLAAWCRKCSISLTEEHQPSAEACVDENALISIASNDIGIPNFRAFRKLRFYKDPDLSNETVEISQSKIISDIIQQAEHAHAPDHSYRDIFITASTGAGKSIMFQIPAVYLAKKYHKLTIIIEPVKALMQDQKEQLNTRGYNRVETFNSDLISQAEKEAVLNRIKSGQTDLLYLSPETLLSYSMDTLIGDREIGLIIVDEAHIVTSWGVGFRPDYWYLGAYINRLRTQLRYKNAQQKIHHFPVCAFTATAVSGGEDDSVSETIVSLTMDNPIKYIGYVKRDDIKFDIQVCQQKKLPNTDYENQKAAVLAQRIQHWATTGEKTIVYFPYASIAGDVKKGIKAFADKNIPRGKTAVFTGRNLDDTSAAIAKAEKDAAFESFRTSKTPVMLATKAFGMGIDINDIRNVYHYAASGNLSDYIQEVGRAARRKDITGCAMTDFFANDMTFMERLYGMSRINQYHISYVLSGIYNVHKSKKYARSFLISPESFTYIFTGKESSDNIEKQTEKQINKLKTSLLMIEKDLYEKFGIKVLIARPRGVFTKAFVVVDSKHTDEVLHSKYSPYLKFIQRGRQKEQTSDGCLTSDLGNIYEIDLKQIWENFYQKLSFPEFKYWYFNFNASSRSEKKVSIMPEIRPYIGVRQKVTVEAKNGLMLCEISEKILADLDCIADILCETFKRSYFTMEDLANAISKQFGRSKARIISHSLFQLTDPSGRCIKFKATEKGGTPTYCISNGSFKDLLRRSITSSPFLKDQQHNASSTISKYMYLSADSKDAVALKMLSVFDYITYEVVGGKEPEIFIRLNDPEKIRRIINGEIKYSNSYVTKAAQKHERDSKIMRRFFTSDMTSEERWDFVESYFLGEDMLQDVVPVKETHIPLITVLDRDACYEVDKGSNWDDIIYMFDDNVQLTIADLSKANVPVPEFFSTVLKKKPLAGNILMSWPSRNTLVFEDAVSPKDAGYCAGKGWKAFDITHLNAAELMEVLD